MGGVTRVNGAERVWAAGEGDGGSSLALRVEDYSCQGLTVVCDGDGTGSSRTVFADYSDGDVCFGSSVDIARVDEERGLRGLLLNCGRGCQRRHCDGAEIDCNPMAEHTYHVHLLQM